MQNLNGLKSSFRTKRYYDCEQVIEYEIKNDKVYFCDNSRCINGSIDLKKYRRFKYIQIEKFILNKYDEGDYENL